MLLSGVGGRGGIWLGIVREIWNHRNRVVFWEWAGRSSGGLYCGTKEDLILGHGKKKDWLFSLTQAGVWNLNVVWGIWKIDIWCFLFNVFAQVWKLWCILCRYPWLFLLGRVGLMCLSWVAIGSCFCFVQVFLVYISFSRDELLFLAISYLA